MKNLRGRGLRNGQQGFTLIELLVALAILGTVSSALTGVVFSIFHTTDDNNGRVEAVTGIEVAAHQISADGMSAASYTIGAGGDSITLKWTDPASGNQYVVDYSLSGTDLDRQCTINEETPSVQVLANDITALTFTGQGSGAFTVAITSTGGGARTAETRTYDVTLRTGGQR